MSCSAACRKIVWQFSFDSFVTLITFNDKYEMKTRATLHLYFSRHVNSQGRTRLIFNVGMWIYQLLKAHTLQATR